MQTECLHIIAKAKTNYNRMYGKWLWCNVCKVWFKLGSKETSKNIQTNLLIHAYTFIV